MIIAAAHNTRLQQRDVAHTQGPDFNSAYWVWTSDTTVSTDPSAPPGTRAFRKTYRTPSGETTRSAIVLIAADNACLLYVNGVIVGGTTDYHAASLLNIFDIDPVLNTFAVLASNTDDGNPSNPAGLLVSVQMITESGIALMFTSDDTWRASLEISTGFEQPGVDDSSWEHATIIGQYQEEEVKGWKSQNVSLPMEVTAHPISSVLKSSSSAVSTSLPVSLSAQPRNSISSTSSAPPASASASRSLKTSSSSHTGVIAGAVVGGFSLCAAIILVAFLFQRCRRSRLHPVISTSSVNATSAKELRRRQFTITPYLVSGSTSGHPLPEKALDRITGLNEVPVGLPVPGDSALNIIPSAPVSDPPSRKQ